MIECDQVPDSKDEIQTSDVAYHYPHLTEIVHHFPSIYDRAQVSLLIGKDLPEAHHVQAHITGQKGIPFAQNLALGWTLKGETCIGKFHKPDVHVYKTSILGNSRSTMLKSCECISRNSIFFVRFVINYSVFVLIAEMTFVIKYFIGNSIFFFRFVINYSCPNLSYFADCFITVQIVFIRYIGMIIIAKFEDISSEMLLVCESSI